METEDFALPERSEHPAAGRAPEAVRCIIHHFKVVPGCDVLDGSGIASAAPDMHTDNAGRPRRDERFDLGRVDVVCGGMHIGEDRRNLLPLQRVSRGDKGVARHDHLTFQIQGPAGQLDPGGGVADGNRMLDSD